MVKHCYTRVSTALIEVIGPKGVLPAQTYRWQVACNGDTESSTNLFLEHDDPKLGIKWVLNREIYTTIRILNRE